MRKICLETLARRNEIRCAGHILRRSEDDLDGEKKVGVVVIHMVDTVQGCVSSSNLLRLKNEQRSESFYFITVLFCILEANWLG